MAAKFFQTSEFRNLEKEWNKKLISSGFEDAEKVISGHRALKQRASNSYRQTSPIAIAVKKEYFEIISKNIHDTQFKKQIDQFVMTKFSEGLKIQKIVKELSTLGISVHRQTIRFIIRRYEHIWGLRFWTAKARNLKRG